MMNTEERTDFLYIGIFIPLGNELGLRTVRANDAYDRGIVLVLLQTGYRYIPNEHELLLRSTYLATSMNQFAVCL